MGLISKAIKKKKEQVEASKPKPFDKTNEIKKLVLFITIVDNGNSKDVVSIFRKYECNAQFINIGEGTAIKDSYQYFGVVDNTKEIIFSCLKKEHQEEAMKEINAFLNGNEKKSKGISMVINMTSIAGVMAYKFLANLDWGFKNESKA